MSFLNWRAYELIQHIKIYNFDGTVNNKLGYPHLTSETIIKESQTHRYLNNREK